MMELEASRSPEHFVYPISDTSKYAIGGDEEIDARTFVESAKQGETSTWRLSTNYRRIQVNDYVWAYFTLPRGEITSVEELFASPSSISRGGSGPLTFVGIGASLRNLS